MPAEVGVHALDPADGVADPGGHRRPGLLGRVPGAARAAAEAVRAGQLGHQEVALLGDPGGRVVVAVGLGVGEALVEVVQALPVRRPRTVVEHVTEVALPGRRPRRRTDQVEGVHLRPGLREQPREVGHPLHRR